jgi:NADH-quinone oxidoreductase subunit C
MTPEEIGKSLEAAGLNVSYQPTMPDPHLEISKDLITEVCRKLRDDEQFAFDSLSCLSGLDYPEHYTVVYNLFSYKHRHWLTLKVMLPKDNAKVSTVSDIFPTAEWHEREAYDLVGITFENHPDLRRILLPEDWEGYPLRKDYQAQEKWHDIPLTAEPPQKSDEGN